ncbi:hypothetical protein BgiMline_017399 [Biomphalaria glabrata]|nr:hypothetical protein BgiBS90_031516 [Biomphalaria glabrata]KAI8762136.1 hypothetical protein BgiMline_005072 [Biomphalaria glabrata]
MGGASGVSMSSLLFIKFCGSCSCCDLVASVMALPVDIRLLVLFILKESPRLTTTPLDVVLKDRTLRKRLSRDSSAFGTAKKCSVTFGIDRRLGPQFSEARIG